MQKGGENLGWLLTGSKIKYYASNRDFYFLLIWPSTVCVSVCSMGCVTAILTAAEFWCNPVI